MKQKQILCDTHSICLNLTPSQEKQLNFLKTLFSPFTKKVYIVGGTIRNHFLNEKNNNDIDIEVHDISVEVFEKLMNDIKAQGVGKSFFVYKYEDIDISLPRTESKVSYGHAGFDVFLAKDEYTASLRRDFTMNALMFNIYTNEVLDFHKGMSDIKNKLIKVVSEISFVEDSLRVLRAIRFASTYNLKIENQSLVLMMNMSIKDLSANRIYHEFKMISLSSNLSLAFYYLIHTNVFFSIFNRRVEYIEFIQIYKYLKRKKRYFNEEMKEFYFLFILKKYLNINIFALNLPKRYKFLSYEPYVKNTISDKELLLLSLEKPIKNYLDSLDINIIRKAKKLQIYDIKLTLDVDINKILENGYKNAEIKAQILFEQSKLIDKIVNVS